MSGILELYAVAQADSIAEYLTVHSENPNSIVNCILHAFRSGPTINDAVIYGKQVIMGIIVLLSPTPGGSGLAEFIFNDFLSAFGNPTRVEASIGKIYRENGLQAAFDWMDAELIQIAATSATLPMAPPRCPAQSPAPAAGRHRPTTAMPSRRPSAPELSRRRSAGTRRWSGSRYRFRRAAR